MEKNTKLNLLEYVNLVCEDGVEVIYTPWSDKEKFVKINYDYFEFLPTELQELAKKIEESKIDMHHDSVYNFYDKLGNHLDYLQYVDKWVDGYDIDKSYEDMKLVYLDTRVNKLFEFKYVESNYISHAELYYSVSNSYEVIKKQGVKPITWYEKVK